MRSYRLAAGLSQEALAERAQMSTNGIGALRQQIGEELLSTLLARGATIADDAALARDL